MKKKHMEAIKIFKAIGDENRFEILELLKGKELCACKLLQQLNLTQSGLSYHMKTLSDSGIVIARQEGKWMHYKICEEAMQKAINVLLEVNK